MDCRFKIENGRVICHDCGFQYPFREGMDPDVSKHRRNCPVTEKHKLTPEMDGPCPHRGDKLGAIRTVCTGCSGTKIVPVPVYACSLMGTCTEQPASGETFVELSKQHRACAGCRRTPNTEG